MDLLHSPFGNFRLQRLPLRKKETLRAWDSADELIVNYLANADHLTESDAILIINDSFGALACNLHSFTVCSWGDSYLAHQATTHNLGINQLESNLTLAPVTTVPDTTASHSSFQWVLIKIPKTLALLEYQLIKLKPCITNKTVVVAAGMVKYLQRSHTELLEHYLGTTTHSLAAKKARLLFPAIEKLETVDPCPYPSSYFQQELQLQLSNHANVFSRDKLDIGARFMIEQYAHLPPAHHIIDLGCGNGVLGIMAKRKQAQFHAIECRVHFVDESYMAISSAKTNYASAFADADQQQLDSLFHVSNGLENTCFEQRGGTAHPREQIDLILCNPPFHQSNTVDDHIARTMFSQSKNVLRRGGQLWVVGNRHLNYHNLLKRLFGNCRTIASNKKFVVLAATAE